MPILHFQKNPGSLSPGFGTNFEDVRPFGFAIANLGMNRNKDGEFDGAGGTDPFVIVETVGFSGLQIFGEDPNLSRKLFQGFFDFRIQAGRVCLTKTTLKDHRQTKDRKNHEILPGNTPPKGQFY